MKYTYILYFENSRPSKLNLFYALEAELISLGINNNTDVKESNRIVSIYQGKRYEITFEKYKHFSQALKIKTDVEFNLKNRVGFITLIWRLMNWEFNVDYGQMEILSEKSFEIINSRIQDRFINQTKLHSLIENKFIPIEVSFEKFDNGQIVITRGHLEKRQYRIDEEAWFSFASKLDYDEWDMTNNEFVPITLEEYKTETTNFSSIWSIEEDSLNIKNVYDVLSILRINKSYNFIEYLIKRKSSIEYISTNVWTG